MARARPCHDKRHRSNSNIEHANNELDKLYLPKFYGRYACTAMCGSSDHARLDLCSHFRRMFKKLNENWNFLVENNSQWWKNNRYLCNFRLVDSRFEYFRVNDEQYGERENRSKLLLEARSRYINGYWNIIFRFGFIHLWSIIFCLFNQIGSKMALSFLEHRFDSGFCHLIHVTVINMVLFNGRVSLHNRYYRWGFHKKFSDGYIQLNFH